MKVVKYSANISFIIRKNVMACHLTIVNQNNLEKK